MILVHRTACLVHVDQGRLGAISLKPTAFLCVHVVELEMLYVKQRDQKLKVLEPLVGKDGKRFKTFFAKEYPPRVCELLSSAMLQPLLVEKVMPTTTVNDLYLQHR